MVSREEELAALRQTLIKLLKTESFSSNGYLTLHALLANPRARLLGLDANARKDFETFRAFLLHADPEIQHLAREVAQERIFPRLQLAIPTFQINHLLQIPLNLISPPAQRFSLLDHLRPSIVSWDDITKWEKKTADDIRDHIMNYDNFLKTLKEAESEEAKLLTLSSKDHTLIKEITTEMLTKLDFELKVRKVGSKSEKARCRQLADKFRQIKANILFEEGDLSGAVSLWLEVTSDSPAYYEVRFQAFHHSFLAYRNMGSPVRQAFLQALPCWTDENGFCFVFTPESEKIFNGFLMNSTGLSGLSEIDKITPALQLSLYQLVLLQDFMESFPDKAPSSLSPLLSSIKSLDQLTTSQTALGEAWKETFDHLDQIKFTDQKKMLWWAASLEEPSSTPRPG